MILSNTLTIAIGLWLMLMGWSIRKKNPNGKWKMFIIGSIVFFAIGLLSIFSGWKT